MGIWFSTLLSLLAEKLIPASSFCYFLFRFLCESPFFSCKEKEPVSKKREEESAHSCRLQIMKPFESTEELDYVFHFIKQYTP